MARFPAGTGGATFHQDLERHILVVREDTRVGLHRVFDGVPAEMTQRMVYRTASDARGNPLWMQLDRATLFFNGTQIRYFDWTRRLGDVLRAEGPLGLVRRRAVRHPWGHLLDRLSAPLGLNLLGGIALVEPEPALKFWIRSWNVFVPVGIELSDTVRR